MPRVSIVIPAYNAAAYLAATLRSVLNSTYTDYEVVVVDDGSTDETAAIARTFDERVRLISQTNRGMSASRNRGIDASDSEFIALLDSDDIWHPRKLALQVAALDAHRDHGFSYTDFTVWDGNANVPFASEARSGRVDPSFSGWIYTRLILTNWALPSSLLLRRSSWETTGPFLCNDQKTDDWEYLVRASRQFRFLKLAESLVLYRQHSSSLSRQIRTVNAGELMRERLLHRYGLQSPDGSFVDPDELERWCYQGWSSFADAHCARGDLGVGVRTFAKLLTHGPQRSESLIRLGRSLFRRVFPKRASTGV